MKADKNGVSTASVSDSRPVPQGTHKVKVEASEKRQVVARSTAEVSDLARRCGLREAHLDDDGRLFLSYCCDAYGITWTDNEDLIDDLCNPTVTVSSTITNSERMRRYGSECLDRPNWSGRLSQEGGLIPTEEYVAKFVVSYGDNIGDLRFISCNDWACDVLYRKMTPEQAINRSGADLRRLLQHEFEILPAKR